MRRRDESRRVSSNNRSANCTMNCAVGRSFFRRSLSELQTAAASAIALFASIAAAALGAAVLLDAVPAQAQDTASIFSTSASDLTVGANYLPNIAVGSANTSDVEFSNSIYSGSSFTVNNSSLLSFGTLDDLNATQALSIITNDGSTTGSITLGSTSNSLSPVGGDLLYVATGGNLSIGTGSAGTLTLNLAASGNIDNAGTLSIAGPMNIGGNTITFTGNGATTVGGSIAGSGQLKINDGFGSVTLSGNNSNLTGNVTLTAGTLNIDSPTALGTGTGTTNNTFTISGGTIAVTGSSDITLTTQNNISVGAVSFAFAGTHSLTFNSGDGGNYSHVTENNAATTLYLTANGGSSPASLSFGIWQLSGGGAAPAIYAMPGSNATLNFGNLQSASNTLSGNANTTATSGITGSGTFTYSSAGTLTVSGTSTYSGTYALEGGTVILNATQVAATMASAAITLEGGNFEFEGNATGTGQTLNGLTVGSTSFPFGSSLTVVGGADGTTLAFGTITDTVAGGTLNIILSGTSPNVTTTSSASSTGLIGSRGAITITSGGTTDFATVSSGAIVPLTSSSQVSMNSGTTSGTTTNYLLTASGLTAGTGVLTPNSLQISNTGTGSLDLGAGSMTITSGGLLYDGSTQYTIAGSSGGTVTSSQSDLIIHNFGTGGLTISAAITGSKSVTLDGPGVTTLSGNNTFSATVGMYVNDGATVSVSADANFGASGKQLNFNGGTLEVTNTFSTSRAILAGPDGLTVDVTGSNVFTVSGSFGNKGTGSVTKTDSGTLILSATSAANYSGGFTYVENGILGTLSSATTGLLPTTTVLVLGSNNGNTSGVFQLGDSTHAKSQTIAGLFTSGSGTGNAVVGGNASLSTLTFTGVAADPSTFAGTLGGSGTNQNNLNLTVTAGELTLSGANTYLGTTTVSGGELLISGSGTLGAATAPLTMSGGTLDLGGTNQTVGPVSITKAPTAGAGYNTIQNGMLTSTSYSVTNTSGNVIVAANLLDTSGSTLSMNGSGGTLTLTGDSTYSGGTTVTAGTLIVANGSNGSATGSGAVNVGVATGAGTFGVSASGGSARSATRCR